MNNIKQIFTNIKSRKTKRESITPPIKVTAVFLLLFQVFSSTTSLAASSGKMKANYSNDKSHSSSSELSTVTRQLVNGASLVKDGIIRTGKGITQTGIGVTETIKGITQTACGNIQAIHGAAEATYGILKMGCALGYGTVVTTKILSKAIAKSTIRTIDVARLPVSLGVSAISGAITLIPLPFTCNSKQSQYRTSNSVSTYDSFAIAYNAS